MSFQSAYKAYQAQQFNEAESAIAAFLHQSPNDSDGLQLGAMIALQRQDLQTALNRIQGALRHSANQHEKLNTLGNIFRAAGEDIRAEDAFHAALAAKPDYSVAEFNLARLYFDTTRPHDAAKHFEHVTRLNPDHVIAWRGYVNALLEAQLIDEAELALAQSCLPDPEKHYMQARFAFYRGAYDTALKRLESCFEDPDVGGASLSLTFQILHMTGQWDRAKTLMDSIYRDYPQRSDLWTACIQSLYQSGNMEAAENALTRAPQGLTLDLVKLDLWIHQGHFEKAQNLASDTLQKHPGTPALMQRLSHAALGNGQFDMAQNVADMGLRATPNNQAYYATKATAGRAKGQDYRYFFNYDEFVRPFELSPPQGWDTMEAFNRDLKAALLHLHQFKGAPLDQTLRLGTQTAPNLKFSDNPAIKAFFKAVNPAIQQYLALIGTDPRHAFLRRNIGGYRIRTAWSVNLGRGGHHVNHVHPEGWISSAYYVDVPPGQGKEGWIKFGEPPAYLNQVLKQTPEYEVQPKAGRLVLFPSYLWHGTYPITGDANRMTLPIDILPAKPGP